MDKEEIKQKPNDGLIARILGGTPTILQKVFFINGSLKFEITAKRLYAASQRVL